MQIILQATHGVVSGAPDFFKRAFGDTVDEFERILLTPHDFIFNREWFESLGGRAEFSEFQSASTKLTSADRSELVNLVSSCDPRFFDGLHKQTANPRLKRILPFYVPKPKQELYQIWEQQKAASQGRSNVDLVLADDERVEDAGLEDDDSSEIMTAPRVKPRKRAIA